MASDGKIVFEVDVDGKNALTDLKGITRDIEQETKKWDNSVSQTSDKLGSNLVDAFKTVAASSAFIQIGRMLVQLGGESITLASDLEEVQNVVDVTFGSAGAATIERWAGEAQKNFGLTELQAKKYTSTLGAMFKSSGIAEGSITDMSTSLAGLTADMSSFYNYGFDEMFQKISAGLAGEVEPLRRLGINMSVANLEAFALANGIETSFNEMSQAEQVMLRYNYLMNATSDAQGDFARTSDSFANSQRKMATGFDTLKAQLGEALLPIATSVSNAVNELLDVLTYRPPETAFDVAEQSINNAEASATQAQGILGYMDTLYEKYGSAATKSEEWASALEKLKTVFPEVNEYIDAETGSLTASNEQLRQYIENSKQAAIEDAKKAALASLNEQYITAGQAYYTAEINRDMAREQAQQARANLISYVQRTDSTFTGNGMSMEQITYAAQSVANELGESQSTINEWARIYNEQTTVAEGFQTEMEQTKASMNSLKADLDIATAALERMSAAATSAASSLGGSSGMNSGQYYNWYYSGKGFATGLDYVPAEGFYHLHPGERVQTAVEANMFREFGSSRSDIDYSIFGAMMRDNIKPGGDVYLDGRVVGSVISAQQGRSYRTLQRSGWQS